MELAQISPLALAYVGDSAYSLKVREYLVNKADYPVKTLTEKTTKYVSGKAQATIIKKMLDENFLSEDELKIFHRGRNAHINSKAKNLDVVSYHLATGFETLYGYLYLQRNQERLEQIWDYIETNLGE